MKVRTAAWIVIGAQLRDRANWVNAETRYRWRLDLGARFIVISVCNELHIGADPRSGRG